MTNRERAIAILTESLPTLPTSQLADVLDATYDICCKCCIYDNDGNCQTRIDNCHDSIKKWLEQEDKND